MAKKKRITRRKFLKVAGITSLSAILATVVGYNLTKFSSNATGRILIIGGGAAGLSMAALLQRWLEKPQITVIDPSDIHYYQPGFTLVASGVYSPEEVWKSQKDCMPDNINWIKDSVKEINPDSKKVTTQSNEDISYDFLVLTPGLQINWEETEGITKATLGEGNAHSIYDFEGAQKTWVAMQEFSKSGGRGIFTDTYTKHKCGGAPKKICLLTEDYARKHGTRDNMVVDYFTASEELYDVPYYTPRLIEIYGQRNISITITTKVKGIDTLAKRVYMERTEMVNDQKIVTDMNEAYDFLHFTPPMSVPDFVREAGLTWNESKGVDDGWAVVDKATLIHKKYPNIVCLGDCAGIPTSKTSAAIRKQVPVAAMNLVLMMEGKEPDQKYNGYAACPIITDYGHVLLCEFDYDKNPQPSTPFQFLDMSKEQAAAWRLKVNVLKPLYFNGMLKGYC